MKYRLFNIASLIILCLSCHAQAEEALTAVKPATFAQPLHFKGIYNFSFSGVPIGKMGIEIEQTPRHYSMAADIITTGLVKLFVKHSSHTTADCSGQNDFTYTECEYESSYQTKNKKKYVKMSAHGGTMGHEKLVPPDSNRPAVAAALKNNVADPLSLVLRMREGLYQAIRNHTSHFTVNMYDGRRLTEVDFTIGGKKELMFKNTPVSTTLVTVRRKLLAGFTPSELSEHNPKEPDVRLYFTDDAKLIPIRAEIAIMFGVASATLAKECLPAENCLLGIKD